MYAVAENDAAEGFGLVLRSIGRGAEVEVMVVVVEGEHRAHMRVAVGLRGSEVVDMERHLVAHLVVGRRDAREIEGRGQRRAAQHQSRQATREPVESEHHGDAGCAGLSVATLLGGEVCSGV